MIVKCDPVYGDKQSEFKISQVEIGQTIGSTREKKSVYLALTVKILLESIKLNC